MRSPARIVERIGFRGAALLLVGLIWVRFGYSVLQAPGYSPDLIHTHWPVWSRLALWWLTGGFAIVVALAKGVDSPSRWVQQLAFAGLWLAPFQRLASYTWSVFFGAGVVRLADALNWLFILALLVLLSAWPEPPPRKVLARKVVAGR